MAKNLLILKNDIDTVLVGDTHGDYPASKEIIESYPLSENQIIFLGDYVDRGARSRENIDYLLETKEKNANLHLLLGNHDFPYIDFSPADFWNSLNSKDRESYKKILAELPLAASVDGIIALHGALPEIKNLQEINDISKEDYYSMNSMLVTTLWGDWINSNADIIGENSRGRIQFGKKYFDRIMKTIGKNVLIRGHDWHAPETLYNGKCLTLFTSAAYADRRPRRIAILKADKEAKTINDLEIKTI